MNLLNKLNNIQCRLNQLEQMLNKEQIEVSELIQEISKYIDLGHRKNKDYKNSYEVLEDITTAELKYLLDNIE